MQAFSWNWKSLQFFKQLFKMEQIHEYLNCFEHRFYKFVEIVKTDVNCFLVTAPALNSSKTNTM